MSINKLGSTMPSTISYTPKKNARQNNQAKSGNTDILTLTQEGRDFLARKKAEKVNGSEKQDIFSKKDQNKSTSDIQMDIFMKQLQESKENKSEDRIQDFAKCMKIAARIMHGDRVPMKDMKFLAEKNPDMFRNAVMLKRHNPEPKKYKSVLDKGDEENEQEQAISESEQTDSTDSFLTSALEDLGV